MSLHPITINLPEPLYQRVQYNSRLKHRSIPDEVVSVLTEAIENETDLPTDLAQELAQLRWLSDEELWQAGQLTATDEENERMQELVEKQQRQGLTAFEEAEAQQLSQFFSRVMLIRAEAAVLLKERGFDISPLVDSVVP